MSILTIQIPSCRHALAMTNQDKVLQYESFLNDRLKPDLKLVLEERDKIYSEIAEYLALKSSITSIQKTGLKEGKLLKAKVDIGCNFYCQAVVDDPSKVIVDIGFDFFVELTQAEALAFIEKKVKLLETKAETLTDESCKVKANIRLTLEGLREIQNLTSEDLLEKKRKAPVSL